MVLILLRNATSIHSRLDARRWRLTCISMHLRLHPSFAYSTSLGRRQEPRAQTPSSSTSTSCHPATSTSLSLSLSRISQRRRRSHSRRHPLGTKTRERKRENPNGDKKRQEHTQRFRSSPFRFLRVDKQQSLSQSRPLLAFQRRRKSGNGHARSSLIRIGYGETRKLIRWNFPLFPLASSEKR